MRTCSIDGCGKGGRIARGMCSMHYQRFRAHGDPLAGRPRYATPEEAFEARTEPIVGDPRCLIWTGTVTTDGHGQLRVNGHMVYAHRYAYERKRGPIPNGMVIDHTCHVPSCANIDHLRTASAAENARNRAGAQENSSTGARGVTRHCDGKRFRAQVQHNGKHRYLGLFPTIEAASIAAKNARHNLFGEYAGN